MNVILRTIRSVKSVCRSNKELIQILMLFLILGIVLFSITSKWELILSVVGVGITLAFGVSQSKLANDRMFKELFTEFNQRYNNLNDDLQRITLEGELNHSDSLKIIDYFNLCAEEYMWFRKSRISCEVWDSWVNGIASYKKNDHFKEVACSEREFDSSYYHFFTEVWDKIST